MDLNNFPLKQKRLWSETIAFLELHLPKNGQKQKGHGRLEAAHGPYLQFKCSCRHQADLPLYVLPPPPITLFDSENILHLNPLCSILATI
jgi:hypothetical protein